MPLVGRRMLEEWQMFAQDKYTTSCKNLPITHLCSYYLFISLTRLFWSETACMKSALKSTPSPFLRGPLYGSPTSGKVKDQRFVFLHYLKQGYSLVHVLGPGHLFTLPAGAWCCPCLQLYLHFTPVKSQQIPSTMKSVFYLNDSCVTRFSGSWAHSGTLLFDVLE